MIDYSFVYIIAEAGVNHNGDAKQAARLVEAAVDAGADAVKFQTFKAERIARRDTPKAEYQLKQTDPEQSQLEMLGELELSEDAYSDLLKACESHGIDFLSTPYSEEDVRFLDRLGVHAFKLASLSVAEPYFVRYVASFGKPLYLSTGMATLEEIHLCLHTLNPSQRKLVTLLQCTSNYPTALEEANIRTISTMRNAFGLPVGYSDHTHGSIASIVAVGQEITVLEKHLTLDHSLPGPDHATSCDPNEFKSFVQQIRNAETALGAAVKKPTPSEKKNTYAMRRGLVAKKNLQKGERVEAEAIALKRPADGIAPMHYDLLIGRVLRRDKDRDSVFTWEDFE